jgi:hypothetical protein
MTELYADILVDIDSYYSVSMSNFFNVYISQDFYNWLKKQDYLNNGKINFIIDDNRKGIDYGFIKKDEYSIDVNDFFEHENLV